MENRLSVIGSLKHGKGSGKGCIIAQGLVKKLAVKLENWGGGCCKLT